MKNYNHYTYIKFHKKTKKEKLFRFIDESKCMGPLSLINILIGQNNSGKSMLVRSMFSLKDFSYKVDSETIDQFNNQIKEYREELTELFKKYQLTSIGDLSPKIFNDYLNKVYDFIPNDFMPPQEIGKIVENLLTVSTGRYSSLDGRSVPTNEQKNMTERIKGIGKNIKELISNSNIDAEYINPLFKHIYIPVLRGMRPFTKDQAINFYSERTINDYFSEELLADENIEVFTGLELYKILVSKLLGEPQDRLAVQSYEKMLSERFFHSNPVTLIPKVDTDTVHIKIGEDNQRAIYDMGDGMQNLIIITFNIFMENRRCIFFIEEPDISMHPAMQRSLIELLMENNKHQYFITTHSNNFIDMTFDYNKISIFHLKKELDESKTAFIVKPTLIPDENILSDIGVRNTSVFLSNSTIWVEGITDRLYIREYMHKYLSEIKDKGKKEIKDYESLAEDKHYSFFEYQGSNLMHWTFDVNSSDIDKLKASNICGKAIVIADGDITHKGDRKAIFEDMLGDRFKILTAKEIENLIPEEILRFCVKEKFEMEGKSVELIKYADYSKNIGLGNYLDGLLQVNFYKAPSGTLISNKKIDLCYRAVKTMRDNEVKWQLNGKIKNLCEYIYDKIMQLNS